MNNYLVSLKYGFLDLRSHSWLPVRPHTKHYNRIPHIKGLDRETHIHLQHILHAALWIISNNNTGTSLSIFKYNVLQ